MKVSVQNTHKRAERYKGLLYKHPVLKNTFYVIKYKMILKLEHIYDIRSSLLHHKVIIIYITRDTNEA